MNKGLINGLETGKDPYSGDWIVTKLTNVVGFSPLNINIFKYKRVNGTIFFYLQLSGTGSGTAVNFVLPAEAAPFANSQFFITGALNNSSGITNCRVDIQWPTAVNCYTTLNGGAWTAGGTRNIILTGFYPAAGN